MLLYELNIQGHASRPAQIHASQVVMMFLQDSVLSDSDAEDEGSESTSQQEQLASPAGRAALTAYSISLRPRHSQSDNSSPSESSSNQPADDAAACSTSSTVHVDGQNAELGFEQRVTGTGKTKRQRGKRRGGSRAVAEQRDSEQQPLQNRPALTLARDPAKDIARAAARGLGSNASITDGLSLVPLSRPSAGSGQFAVSSGSFNVSSFSAEGGLQSNLPAMSLQTPRQLNVLEPVEFAIDRPPWRRTSSSQSRRLQSFVSFESDRKGQSQHAALDMQPPAPSMPSVVTPILTTAQLDPDCMESDRAIPDYPWHYNFIPATRRAPVGTAGFAANANTIEQERRRLLLVDAQRRHNGVPIATLTKDAAEEECIPAVPYAAPIAANQSRLMGYSRSLSGTAYRRQLPSLEINGHPVSLRPGRPNSARVTIN